MNQPGLAREHFRAGPAELLSEHPCAPANEERCQELRATIESTWEQLQGKLTPRERTQLRLQLNHALEAHKVLSLGAEPFQMITVEQKYRALQDILQTTERLAFAAEPDIAYHHLEMKAVQDVMERFGPLELNPADISSREQPYWQTHEVKTPWASYWYPRYDPVLYTGDQSVFAKVDRMMARIGRESQAQSVEASQASGHPESWEGLCNAWSNAAILEPEPTMPLEALGETLSISDQKALFTKLYEAYPVTMYGVRYNGDYLTDGTYQDIRPEALHRLALTVLGSMKKPFIIDDTAGTEVWQQPVFRVDWAIHQDPTFDDAYQVSMKLWKIKMRSRVSDQPTTRDDYAFDQLQYRLFVNPDVKDQEGRLVVIAGEWLGNSRKNHPDYVVMPQENGWPGTYNSWLQKNLDPLLALLRHPSSFWRPE
jgi:hypothetical protein